METTQLKKQSPTLKNIFSYAIGDLYGGGAFFIIGALFLVFLTDVAKVNPALAGTIIFVGKLWDAITDPTMGYISDNTRSKHGRRRLYFLIGIVPIFLSWVLLWTSFGIDSTVFKFVYYLLVYLLFNTVFTLVMVPYNSMPAEMATDYKDRSRLITVRMLFSQGGMLLGAVLPITIVNFFLSDLSTGYIVMATIFGIIFSVPWIFVYKGTYERDIVYPEVKKKNIKEIAVKISRDFASTVKNKSLKIHSIMYITAYVSMDVFNALLIYYIRDDLNKYSSYQFLLGTVVIFQILSLYVVMKSCNKFGNAKTYRIHASIWMLAILVLFSLNSGVPLWTILLVGIVIGFGLSGCVMTPYNMLAFVVDADQMITTKRREGIYAGMMTFLRKIAQALALFFVGVGLQLVDYRQPIGDVIQVQSDSTLLGIRLMFFITPLVLLSIGIISSFKFKITPEYHEILLSEINRLADGGKKSEVTEKTKNVVEEITGLTYDVLWDSGDLID
ncbi:MAG: MFS transporter [Candidatus Izimaplasma sp.]|nr:MFS transporter [Candidatus Izimaplasma bacterium]